MVDDWEEWWKRRMEVVGEVVGVVGRIGRVVVKLVKVVVVMVEGVVEVVRVVRRIGGLMLELWSEGRGLLGVVGSWLWEMGGWLREVVGRGW